ncbi:hypothetical protein CCB80_05545 [Armatimonadetes bacterium Uphvl-Ar1]|nr:hypothetical protein CCB80_05545 [Armatimonadetes bacterium Uphvl-Ar1]
MKKLILIAAPLCLATAASATTIAHDLSASDFTQDWSNNSLITLDDNWSGVASIMGYRGDGLATAAATDARTILADGSSTPLDVNANQTNPNSFTSGGVTEFQLTDSTIALAGSSTARAPHLVLYMNATGRKNVQISFDIRDLESGTDNAIQQVTLQYRIGNFGNFTQIAGAYVADATLGSQSGPNYNITSSLTQWDNIADLQFRIMTVDAQGADEWVGIDNISVTSEAIPEPATMTILAGAAAMAALRRRKK